MNDIYILKTESLGGFRLAVVGVPPGDTPYGPLIGWFESQAQNPRKEAERFEVVDRIEAGTTVSGVIAVAEYDRGSLAYGRTPRFD